MAMSTQTSNPEQPSRPLSPAHANYGFWRGCLWGAACGAVMCGAIAQLVTFIPYRVCGYDVAWIGGTVEFALAGAVLGFFSAVASFPLTWLLDKSVFARKDTPTS